MTYRVTPLLLGDAVVPDALDVLWSLSKETKRSTVPILAFLIEGATDGPILIDCGMRAPERAMEVRRLGPHSATLEQTFRPGSQSMASSWGTSGTCTLRTCTTTTPAAARCYPMRGSPCSVPS